MSGDDTIEPADDGNLVAAEFVLGVLSATERREVERRLAQEPALASEVAFWEERLAGWRGAGARVAPPGAAWSRIETAIRATPRRPSVWQSVTFWRSFAIVSSMLAAASIAALAYIGLVPSARAPLMATLGGSAGQPNFVATVSANGTSITVVPAALLTNDPRAIELWLIQPGSRPRSLGLVLPGQPIRLITPPDLVGQISPESTLAVSLEPAGGSPTGQPTGPVIASGKLTAL